MTTPAGRHRRSGARGLALAGVLAALGIGFLTGFVTKGAFYGDPASASPSTSASSSATSSESSSASSSESSLSPSVPPMGPSQTPPPPATGSAAHADPIPPGPQGNEAYLAALHDAGLPVEDHRDTLLVLGHAVCKLPPEQRADTAAAGQRIFAAVGDLLSADQAQLLAKLAVNELC